MPDVKTVAAAGVAAIALVAAGFGAGWVTNGWRLGAAVSDLQAGQAKAALASSEKALGDLVTASENVSKKAAEYTALQTTIGAQLAAIRKDLKNAPPLPVGCRPDDYRVRSLADAVNAAKQAAAAR